MAHGSGRSLPPLPKLSSPRPVTSKSPTIPPWLRDPKAPKETPASAASKKASPTLAELELGPPNVPVAVKTEMDARGGTGSFPKVTDDEEFLDIVTSSHPALKLDPKILEEPDDFEQAAPDIEEDFFKVTDDDDEDTLAVAPPAEAANPTPAPGPTQTATREAAAPVPAPAVDMIETEPEPDPRPGPRPPVTQAAASTTRASEHTPTPAIDLHEARASTTPPRRRSAAAFAGGLGLGIAAGIAAALLLIPNWGGDDGGDGEGVGISSASLAPAVAPACPEPDASEAPEPEPELAAVAPSQDDAADAVVAGEAVAVPEPEAPEPEASPLAEDEPAGAIAAVITDDGPDTAAEPTPAQTEIAAVEDEDASVAAARAALSSTPRKAFDQAAAVHDAEPNNAAVEVMVIAQCELRNGPEARKLYRQLKFKDPRRRAADRCLELDVAIFAKTLEATPKEMLESAFQHYAKGETVKAEELALESFKERRRPEALALVGMIACDAGDTEKAGRYAQRIDGDTHDNLVAHCTDKGITLPEK